VQPRGAQPPGGSSQALVLVARLGHLMGPNESAVKLHLKLLRERDAELAGSPLAVAALTMARELDRPESRTSASMANRELRETLKELRELAPKQKEATRLDGFHGARDARLAGRSKAPARKRS
jgi:hypothetical protein